MTATNAEAGAYTYRYFWKTCPHQGAPAWGSCHHCGMIFTQPGKPPAQSGGAK